MDEREACVSGRPRARLSASLTGRVSTLPLVAELVWAFAELAGLEALARDALGSAVLEAAKNVVYHAYDGAEGSLELELILGDGSIEAVVRDRGMGIRPMVGERSLPHSGIGMGIIHAAADRILYTTIPTGGTELRMFFGAAPEVLSAPVPGVAPSGPPCVAAYPAALGSAAAGALARHLASELDAGEGFVQAAAREAGARASRVASELVWLSGTAQEGALVLLIGGEGDDESPEELRLPLRGSDAER